MLIPRAARVSVLGPSPKPSESERTKDKERGKTCFPLSYREIVHDVAGCPRHIATVASTWLGQFGLEGGPCHGVSRLRRVWSRSSARRHEGWVTMLATLGVKRGRHLAVRRDETRLTLIEPAMSSRKNMLMPGSHVAVYEGRGHSISQMQHREMHHLAQQTCPRPWTAKGPLPVTSQQTPAPPLAEHSIRRRQTLSRREHHASHIPDRRWPWTLALMPRELCVFAMWLWVLL